MATPFDGLPTRNITPDNATGIGDWTNDEFYRVFAEGVGKNGEYLYPGDALPLVHAGDA